jgi:hypothetical protein
MKESQFGMSKRLVASALTFVMIFGLFPALSRAADPSPQGAPANTLKPYFGQIHTHTSNSDGTGSYGDAYTMARDTADLDFFAVTDHSNYFDSASSLGTMAAGGGSNGSRWTSMRAAADQYNEDGAFVALAGFEMTWSNKEYGHINTYNTPGYVSRNDAYFNLAGGLGLQRYYAEISKYSASISQLNHPGTTFGDFSDFAYYNAQTDAVLNLIEVGNGDGTNKQLNAGYWRSDAYYDRALELGWHLAPTNNQDNHRANWGVANDHRTVALVESLTRDNILDALQNRRIYASEDKNAEVLFFINNEPMGTIMSATPDSLHFDIDLAEHDENIGSVYVVTKGGQIVRQQNVASETEKISFDLSPEYDYYYVKIVQADGDMILTAPVWVTPSVTVDPAGITRAEAPNGAVFAGDAAKIGLSLFNSGVAFRVESIELVDTDNSVLAADTEGFDVASGGMSRELTLPSAKLGLNSVKVVVTGSVDGTPKTFTYVVSFNGLDPNGAAKIVVDASHSNMYVNGQYSGGLATIEQNLLPEGVAFVYADALTDDVLSGAAAVLITTPENRNNSATRTDFSAEDIAVLTRYAQSGGNLILMARADYGEDASYQSSVMLNRVLAAFGATTRVNSDELIWGGNTSAYTIEQVLTYNTDIPWMKNVDPAQLAALPFRIWSGASLAPGANTVPFVSGVAGVSSYDSNSAGAATNVGSGTDIVFAAQESLPSGGTAFIGGGLFFTTYNEQDKTAYINHPIAEEMIKSLKREASVSTIAEARRGAIGQAFTVEGILTTDSPEAVRDNAFFDCIYIQDETGGICVHPVINMQLYIGQRVRIAGVIKEYVGDKELGIPDGVDESECITLLDASKRPVEPQALSTANSMSGDTSGLLVKVRGTVTRVTDANNVYLDDGSGEARLLIEGYIADSATGEKGIPSFVQPGAEISAVGLASVDERGARLRVRDLAEIRLLPYVSCDLNKDGAVDQIDLAITALYCRIDNEDPRWNTLVIVYDTENAAITAALCDMNSDGVVNMLDLLGLYTNYTR